MLMVDQLVAQVLAAQVAAESQDRDILLLIYLIQVLVVIIL
jgi:hypothetical protein